MDMDLRKINPQKAEELVTTLIVGKVVDIISMKSLAQNALTIVYEHKKSMLTELTDDQEEDAKELQTKFMNFMMMSDDKDAKKIIYEHSKYMAENQTLGSLQYISSKMLNKAAVNEHDLMFVLHGIKIADLPYDKEAITLTFNKANHNQHEHTWCYINIHLYEDSTDPDSRTLMVDYPLYFFASDESLPIKAVLQRSNKKRDEQDDTSESNTDDSSSKIKINVN